MPAFMNDPENLVLEGLRGYVAAHRHILTLHETPRFLVRGDAPVPGKVALISGGGSGHEPLHIGFVGRGMLDAACPGEIFTSPTPDQIMAATHAVDGGAGVLFLVKNYSGDIMNFDMAGEMLEQPVETVLIADEATAPGKGTEERRGMAGTILVQKMVGAAAQAGFDLGSCKLLGERVNRATRTKSVALSGCVMPGSDRPAYHLEHGLLEYGIGLHGERGRTQIPYASASELAFMMIGEISADLELLPREQVLLLVNGTGGSPLLELGVILHEAETVCRDKGLEVVRSLVGNYATTLGMAGCSITLCRMDQELLSLWDAPVHTAALRWGM